MCCGDGAIRIDCGIIVITPRRIGVNYLILFHVLFYTSRLNSTNVLTKSGPPSIISICQPCRSNPLTCRLMFIHLPSIDSRGVLSFGSFVCLNIGGLVNMLIYFARPFVLHYRLFHSICPHLVQSVYRLLNVLATEGFVLAIVNTLSPPVPYCK